MALSSHSPFAKEAAIRTTSNNPPSSNGHAHTRSKAHVPKGHKRAATMPANTTIDTTDKIDNTAEFAGDRNTNNEIPSQQVLMKVENMTLLDKDGKSVPFKNLYTGPNVARRVLIIFIRHFFCGVCYFTLPSTILLPSSRLQTQLVLTTPRYRTVKSTSEPSLSPQPPPPSSLSRPPPSSP
jgi:hypothetical protein